MKRLAITTVLLIAAVCCGQSTSAPTSCIVVFDLLGVPNQKSGAALSDSIRLKLRRHEGIEVVDRITTQDIAPPIGADTPLDRITSLLTDKFAATGGVFGTLNKDANSATATVTYVTFDTASKKLVVRWTKEFRDDTVRWKACIAKQIVQAVRQAPQWIPPQYGDEATPSSFGKPLNVNGDFENGYRGWDQPDLVSTFLIPGPKGRGTILRVRTDLARDPWLEYRRKLRLGLTDPSKAPQIKRDTSYGSVAGLEGVHYRSHWIKATPGQRYWLVAETKNNVGGKAPAKVFVKGFLDWSARATAMPERSLADLGMTPQQLADLPEAKRRELIAADARKHPKRYLRECYRWYLACENDTGDWKRFAAPFPPRGGLPKNVQWLQIQIYSYWPPGEYLWDNVHLYKAPGQKTPITEEKARTPNYKAPATKPTE